MANGIEISAVLYGGGVVFGPDGKVAEEARVSIANLPEGMERGAVFVPYIDIPATREALEEANLVGTLDVIDYGENIKDERDKYYEIYSRAVDRLRCWPKNALVVESQVRVMEALHRLKVPFFVMTQYGDRLPPSLAMLGPVGTALPDDFDKVDEFIADHAKLKQPVAETT